MNDIQNAILLDYILLSTILDSAQLHLILTNMISREFMRCPILYSTKTKFDQLRRTFPIPSPCNDFLNFSMHSLSANYKRICKPLLISFFITTYIFYFIIFWFCKVFTIQCQIVLIFKDILYSQLESEAHV